MKASSSNGRAVKVVKRTDLSKLNEIVQAPEKRKARLHTIKLNAEKRQFAVVRGSGGRKVFRRWHDNIVDATNEAERLAREIGGLFVVIEARMLVIKPAEGQDKTDLTHLKPSDNIPDAHIP